VEKSQARGQQKMRLQVGVFDVVGQLTKRFPARRDGAGDDSDSACAWSADDMQPFITGGAQVDAVIGARVQQSVAILAVTVYTTLGKRGLDAVMLDLPVAAKELILHKIEEETGMVVEDVEPDDMPDDDFGADDDMAGEGLDLCITGSAMQVPAFVERANISKTDGQEENLMDDILEETGLVFQGQSLKVAYQPKYVPNALDEDLRMLGMLEPTLVV